MAKKRPKTAVFALKNGDFCYFCVNYCLRKPENEIFSKNQEKIENFE